MVRFFSRYLRHKQGGQFAGQPFHLQPWQATYVRQLIGTLRDDGRRLFRKSSLWVARKNGKTSLAAGLALYLLMADGEPGAEIYSLAADANQAAISFGMGRWFVESHESLTARCKIFKSAIEVPELGAVWRVLSGSGRGKHGYNAHALIADEIHEYGPEQAEAYEAIATSMGSRSQPLIINLSTPGYDRTSFAYEQYTYDKQVAEGIIPDRTHLPLIFETDEDADYHDLREWKKANPNFEVTVTRDFAEQEILRADHSPSHVQTVRRLYLGQWTESSTRWLSMHEWDQNGRPLRKRLKGRPCYAGLDLASTRDVTALVLVFPDSKGGYDVLPFCWIPEDSARERMKRDKVPYPTWVEQGLIRTTRGKQTDYEEIRRDINDLVDRGYQIRKLAIDRLFQGAILATELASDGLDVKAFGQGFYSMAAPTLELERLVIDHKLRHAGHPVLRWHAANTVVEMDPAGCLKPSKKASTERIDLIVSLIMAIAMATAEADPTEGSVYERRGVLEI